MPLSIATALCIRVTYLSITVRGAARQVLRCSVASFHIGRVFGFGLRCSWYLCGRHSQPPMAAFQVIWNPRKCWTATRILMNSNALSLSNCRGPSDKGRPVARCQVLVDPVLQNLGWRLGCSRPRTSSVQLNDTHSGLVYLSVGYLIASCTLSNIVEPKLHQREMKWPLLPRHTKGPRANGQWAPTCRIFTQQWRSEAARG
jgi:hypothetical protein